LIYSRIFWKLYLSFLLLTLLTIPAIGLVVIRELEQQGLREVTETLRSCASLFIDAEPELIYDSASSVLQDRIRELDSKLDARFTVIRVDGIVIADSDQNPSTMDNHGARPEVLEARDKGIGTSIRFSNTLQKKMLYVALPIRDNGVIIGYSRASFPLVKVDERLARMRTIGLLGTIVGTLIALPMGVVIARRAVLPLTRMTELAHSVAEGNYARRLSIKGNDEFSKLASALNKMAAQIGDDVSRREVAEQELKKAQSELERRVGERTAELSSANSSLEKEIIERKKIEEALRDQQRFLREVVDADPNLIFVKDWNGRFTFANRALAEMYGTTVENILGKCDADFNSNHEEVDRFLRDDREVMKSLRKKFVPEEPNTKTGNGEVSWFQAIKLPLASPESDLESRQVLGVATDITERKRAEAERLKLLSCIQEQREQLSNLIANVPGIVWENMEPAGPGMEQRVYTSVYAEELLGYNVEQWLSTPDFWLQIVHPDDKEQAAAKAAEILASGKAGAHQARFIAKDGRVLWLEAHMAVVRDDAGNSIGLRGVTMDVTQRKLAEDKIGRLSRQNQLLLDSAGEGIFGLDLQGCATFVNPAAARMLGREAQEIIGQKIHNLIHHSKSDGRPYPPYECPSYKALSDGIGLSVCDEVFWAKDGRSFPVEYLTHPVFEDEKLAGAVVTFNDITERRESEIKQAKLKQQLHQAQKMEAIGTLAGGIAHDFNNILNAIIGYSELAADDLQDGHSSRSHIAQVLKASNRAKELVQQILAFSRRQEPELKPISLQPVIDDVLKLLRASLPSTIEIRRIIKEVPRILGDAGRIHQVMMNLGTNALHAMRERGGKLEVKLETFYADPEFVQTRSDLREGKYLRLSISDTGCGMDRCTQERIFEPFFTTKSPGEGTGLGLTTVYGIVKEHGGAISVYSEPGSGTVFNIYLPAVESVAAKSPIHPDSIPKGRGQRILFVDDEETLADLGKKRLERLGYEVTVHTNSIEALRTFQESPGQYDLLISDYTMPGMNGADLAKNVLEARSEMPVILITGYSTTINPEIIASIGIREMLMKPVTAQAIGEAVHRVLANGRKE
jgi:PAS domain S-box-containing protein